jgi:short subunit dehydrogenase-like uncharacterized protein
MERDYDIVLFGATGFTGRLAAEYLAAHAPAGLSWAIAGRNADRLAGMQGATGAPGVIVADSTDPGSIDRMVGSARIVASTAGPFAVYSDPVVDACVRHGTDYVDITGETGWVRTLIDRFHDRAATAGTKLIPFCGFDSVPSDLGVAYAIREVAEMYSRPTARVSGAFIIRGGLNGGTLATMLLGAERGGGSGFGDPLLLNPADARTKAARARQPDRTAVRHDADLGTWTMPFVMAGINTRVVRRSAALAAQWGDPYGPEFVYEEAAETRRRSRAYARTAGLAGLAGLLRFRPGRSLLRRLGPDPGEGPSAESRARGFMRARFVATADDGRKVLATVRADGDPGNAITVTALIEAALALAVSRNDLPGGPDRGGVLTPATGLGRVLEDRLRAAGFSFVAEPLP